MDEVGNGIIAGAVAGTIAGIMVSMLLTARRVIVARCRRRDQTNYIREMITTGREQVYGVPDEDNDPSDPSKPNADDFRYIYFDSMRRELDLALDGRATEITFDEIRQVKRMFVLDDLFKSKVPDRRPIGLRHYDNIFGGLEKIEWLKLPQRGSAT